MREEEQKRLESFLESVKDHEMVVEMDHGVNRSLLFKKPENGWHLGFRIVTWKGGLSITGDMGSGTFERVDDMFSFFRRSDLNINTTYWHEKQTADCCKYECALKYDSDKFKAYVKEDFNTWCEDNSEATQEQRDELWDELETEVLYHGDCEHEARRVMSEFEWKSDDLSFEFIDEWEANFQGYTHGFLWRLHAIVFAISMYDVYKATPRCPECSDTGLRKRYNSGLAERSCPHPMPCMKCEAGTIRLNLEIVQNGLGGHTAPHDALKSIGTFLEDHGILKPWALPQQTEK